MNFTEIDALVVANQIDDAETLYKVVSKRLKGEGTVIEQFCWAEHAAKLNLTDGIQDVFSAYRKGTGVAKSSAKAFAWLCHGASLKGGGGFYIDLATAYRDGDGTVVDIQKFWEYMLKAAELEDGREAMYHLARAYDNPALGPLSKKLSLFWTTRMAEAKAAGAMTQLAKLGLQSEKDKDRKDALSWAEKAVAAAKLAVDTVNISKSDPLVRARQEWVYEDYPDALATHADVLRELGQLEEARKSDKEAAEAALEAVELSVAEGEKPSLRLPAVMLLEVANHAQDGRPSKGERGYVDWLKIVGWTIEQSLDGAFTRLPAELSGAILSLAHAFKNGVGVDEDQHFYISWLQKAADWGSSVAATEYAMHRRPTEPADFKKYIDKATEAGENMRAYIYKVVDECKLNDKLFDKVSKLLIKVLEATDNIKMRKHSVNQKKPVVHYTKPEALKSMLENQTKPAKNLIRLYNIAYVNDPKEGKRLTHYKREKSAPNPLDSFYEKREDGDDATRSKWQEFSVFLASFSLEKDNLNLWRFYGDDGTGFSVVTPFNAFNTALEQRAMGGAWASQDESSAAWSPLNSRATTITLNKVLYSNKDVEATLRLLEPSLAALNKWLNPNNVDADQQNSLRSATVTILSELMYLYKEEDYEAEREVRAVEARLLGSVDLHQHPGDSASFSRLYLETAAVLFKSEGSKIIIGPKVQKKDAVMLDIRHQLATMGWGDQCKVEHSLRPYR